jgi:hypothetical protein
LSKPGEDHWKA